MEAAHTSEPWSDDTFFDDGTGWRSGPLPSTVDLYEGAAARATSVVIEGLPANTARCLRRGDLFEIRRNGVADYTPSLHRVIRDCPTDATGKTRVDFVPPLRKGVAAHDMIVL